MKIGGTLNSKQFDYIKLSLKRCNPAKISPGKTCTELSSLEPRILKLYIPEPSVNYEESDHQNALTYALNGFHALLMTPTHRNK